jgi:antitoxin VapB
LPQRKLAKGHTLYASICYGIGRPSGREDIVQTERVVRLFRNGRNQAVRIPRDLELPGSEALLRKEGNRLIVEPIPRPGLLKLLSTWAPLEEEFPDVDNLEPIEDVNL